MKYPVDEVAALAAKKVRNAVLLVSAGIATLLMAIGGVFVDVGLLVLLFGVIVALAAYFALRAYGSHINDPDLDFKKEEDPFYQLLNGSFYVRRDRPPTKYEWVCPTCKTVNDEGDQFCKECSSGKYSATGERAKLRPTRQFGGWTCPCCGAHNNATYRFCKNCKTSR